jgi:hypothetical protein
MQRWHNPIFCASTPNRSHPIQLLLNDLVHIYGSLKLADVALYPVWDDLAELEGFINDLCEDLQSTDALATGGPRLSIGEDVGFEVEGLQELAYLTKDLGTEGEVELWVEYVVQAGTVVCNHACQLI